MCELKACIYDLCCHRGLAPRLQTCEDANTCREHAKANLKKLDYIMPKAPGYCPSCLKRASQGHDLVPHTTPRVGDVLNVNRLKHRLGRGSLARTTFGSRSRLLSRPLARPPVRRSNRPRTRRATVCALTTPNASSAIKPYDANDVFMSPQELETPTKSSQTSIPQTPSSVAPPLPPTGKRRHRITPGKPASAPDCLSSPIATSRRKRVKNNSSASSRSSSRASTSSGSSGSSVSSSSTDSTTAQKRDEYRSKA